MAHQAASGESRWRCLNCETLYENEVYRCTKCEKSRPYSPSLSTYDIPDEEPDSLSEADPGYPHASLSVTSPIESITSRVGHILNDSQEERMDFPADVCRLVLLGKTGSGKSSSANTIVGSERYGVSPSLASTTTRCQWHEVQRFGINLEVVDTPGFYDTHLDDAVVTKEIVKCIGVVSPGPHALLVVVRIDVKFTEEDAQTMEHIRSLFGPDVMRHVIIIFTHGDKLEGEAINKRLEASPPPLQQLLEETYKKYVVFNNNETDNTKNAEQVKKLLVTVRGQLASSGNQYFSCPFLDSCQEAVMARTESLSAMLDESYPSERARQLIRTALVERDNAEDVLHQIMDKAGQDNAELESHKKNLKWLEAEKAQATNKIKEANKRLVQLESEREQVNREVEDAKSGIKRLNNEKTEVENESKKDKEKIKNLELALEACKKLESDLKTELEKKKWKCSIL